MTMHQSRLAGFIIDCNVQDLAGAAAFWGAALRMDVRELPAAEGSKYMRLVDPEGRLHIEVQTVTHPSRVHLDIESTDVEAEVVRLEGLGARRVAQVHTWWVMEAPTGQRFCVVRKGSKPSALERWHRIVARATSPTSTTCWPTMPCSNPRPCTRRNRARRSPASTWPQRAPS